MKTNLIKKLCCLIFIISFSATAWAQGVGINDDNSSPDPSAALDVKSTTKGLLIPRMTTTQRNAIATPATSLLVFDTDTNTYWFFDGTNWAELVNSTDELNSNLSISNDTLYITDAGGTLSVDLSGFVENTTNELNTSAQLNGNNLEIVDAGGTLSVDLSSFMDNTDNQDLDLAGNTLSLTNDGTTVDLSSYLDNTDNQDLSLAGSTLSLTNDATTVDLSTFLDNTDNQDLSLAGNTLSLTNDATTVDLSTYLDNTDAQTLTFAASTLTISNGNSVTLPDGDITGVTAGTGLTNGGTTGAITINAVGDNGLTTNADDIDLGGTLNQNTTITQAGFSMNFNLTGTGDFNVQDAGTTHFQVADNGITYFGDDSYWRDGSVTGTNLASLIDDGDDGRFRIYENGIPSVDLDANTQFIFNEQGLDRNFRIESNNNANLFFLDAGLDRIGVGTTTPDNLLDVFGKISVTQSAGDEMVIINDDVWQHGSGNQDFGTGGAHFIMASRETDYESGGIYGDGNVMTLWSPGDANNGQPSALIYVCDEDRFDGATDANPHNNNSVYAYLNTAGNWVAASDRNRKENIVPLTSSLEKVVQIQSYQYNFKQTEEEIQKGSPAPHSLGVIAQEVENIIPEVVEKSADGDYYVSYIEFIPVLLEAVKEQNALVEAQKSEIESLKAEQESMKQELEEIKAMLKEMNK